MSELKPCPFCGGEAEMLTAESMNGGYLFGIMCNDCRSRGDVYDTEAEAIAAWNTRAVSIECAGGYCPHCAKNRAVETCRNVNEEWAKKSEFYEGETSFCCSECGARYSDCESYYAYLANDVDGAIPTNYCPSCGRKVER